MSVITLHFENATHMKHELASLGFKFVGDAAVQNTVQSPISLPAVQSAEEQIAALDAVLGPRDDEKPEVATAVPESQIRLAETDQTQEVVTESTATEAPETKPVTVDTLRAACIQASKRVGTARVNGLLKDTYQISRLDELAADLVPDAFARIEALQPEQAQGAAA